MSGYIFKPPAKLPPGSTVIAYLRDSGGPNQEDSIGQQEKAILEYCQRYGLVLTRLYAETASGRKIKHRDQFLEMFEDVMKAPQDTRPAGLLLWAYSRFSRDIADFNYFLYGLIRTGLVVHSLTEEIPEGIAGQMMLQLKAYTNADYSIQLGINIKRGIADRVQAGYSNGGTPPRGYRIVREYHGRRRGGAQRIGVRWEPDPELAPLVVIAWELRAQGKGYSEITKATGGRLYINKNCWTTHFKNKSYLGIGKAGELEVEDHHPALISWELWEAVRKIESAMPRRGRSGDPVHPRRMSHPSLLSGLSVCVYCGAAMILHTSKDYRSYQCGKKDRQGGFRECTEARSVNARKADKAILDAVLNRILTPDQLDPLLAEIQNQSIDNRGLDREIGAVSDMLTLTDRSIARLVRLAEETGDVAEIAGRLKDLKQEKASLTVRLKSLKAERASDAPVITPEALELVFNIWRSQIEAAIEHGDILAAKKLLSKFVSKIELGYKDANIHYVYPLAIPSEDCQAVCAHCDA